MTRVELDIAEIEAEVALQAGHLAGEAAELLRQDIVASIPDSIDPSPPGSPPHSPGPYRNSWKSTKPKRDRNGVVAYAFSLAQTSQGQSLALELERGGRNAPRPHVRPAVSRVQGQLDALAGGTDILIEGGA